MSAHVNRVHAGKAMKKDTNKGAFLCDYCEETFQSSRSRSMHVRNQHAAAQSARLAEESSLKTLADSQPRHWDEETVRQFVRALFVVGTGSNVEIAREMKSKKTAHNVKGYKLRILKDHPDWKTEFRQLDPEYTPSDSGENCRRRGSECGGGRRDHTTTRKRGGTREHCRVGDPCGGGGHSGRGCCRGDGAPR